MTISTSPSLAGQYLRVDFRLPLTPGDPRSLAFRCRFICHTPPNNLPLLLPHPHRSSMKAMKAASTEAGYRMLSKARLRFMNDPDGIFSISNPFFHSFTHYSTKDCVYRNPLLAPISPERIFTVTLMQVRITQTLCCFHLTLLTVKAFSAGEGQLLTPPTSEIKKRIYHSEIVTQHASQPCVLMWQMTVDSLILGGCRFV